MDESDNGNRDAPAEDGFEFGGVFYRWHVGVTGKDLMLIDRFAGMPIDEFFDAVDDDYDRARAPVMLTLIATSMRHRHPEWTVERIVRTVMDLSLADVVMLNADTEADTLPPASEGENAPTGGDSSSESRSLSSVPSPEISATSSGTPG